MNYIVATTKSWNIKNYKTFFEKKKNIHIIKDKKELNLKKLKKIGPKYIFFPHWSWIIPRNIWSKYNCVVFHMTDLPFGRGGTPLQNLILRGYKKTKISAIKVDQGIDTGEIYLKRNLNLNGSAEDIYKRASNIVFSRMIPLIIDQEPIPEKQSGRSVKFKRRRPEQSKIPNNININGVYDFIRMLDAEGYPRAFLETKNLKYTFNTIKKKKNKLIGNIEIYEK